LSKWKGEYIKLQIRKQGTRAWFLNVRQIDVSIVRSEVDSKIKQTHSLTFSILLCFRHGNFFPTVLIVFFFFFFFYGVVWLFDQHKDVDCPWNCGGNGACSGCGCTRLHDPIQQVSESGHWYYTGPLCLFSVSGKASRSNPGQAHDPGPPLYSLFLNFF